MLKFKINVADALARVQFGTADAKDTGFLSQDTLKKLQAEDTAVMLQAINSLCVLLDMEIKDIIQFEMTPEEQAKRGRILERCKSRHRRTRSRAGNRPGVGLDPGQATDQASD